MSIMEHLQNSYDMIVGQGYEVLGVFLQGSQNYCLDCESSDIDAKAIILPKFKDIVLNHQPISTTKILESNEHVDLKDIRLMFSCFRKQNINFVEILFTKYCIINKKYEEFVQLLLDNNEMIARYNNYAAINCIAGMSKEKLKSLCHITPAVADKIERFGYDPKQLHHIIRLNEFLKRYIAGESYADCLISKQREYLIDVKKGLYSLEEAKNVAEKHDEETNELRKEYMKENPLIVNKDVDALLDNTLYNIMKLNFVTELSIL